MTDCNCKRDELNVHGNILYYTDCEGILRSFQISFCPFCGEFKDDRE